MMILKELFNLCFPNCCQCCQTILNNDKYICKDCFNTIKKTDYHFSPRNNELFYTLYKIVDIEGAFSFFYFENTGVLKMLIHKLKYNNKKNIGIWLGEKYGKILENNFKGKYDLIIPIPLSKSKINQRGYNQSEMISIGLNKYLLSEINIDSLVKSTETSSQTTKNKKNRRIDIINSFDVKNINKLKNKNMLLVDDVITTGSTMLECVETIKKVVNCYITVCSIARTL